MPICRECPHYNRETVDRVSHNDCSPVFSLGHMTKKYSLNKCTADEKSSFADHLVTLSQLRWTDIIQANKHGLGSEKISQDSIRGDSIPEIVERDTQLLALRFSGLKSMVGFRERDVFHILWFDRDFSLYKHE